MKHCPSRKFSRPVISSFIKQTLAFILAQNEASLCELAAGNLKMDIKTIQLPIILVVIRSAGRIANHL
tara:strand:- start:935 stop:1138 length:204 start_codon:yes stop_codon:yes gene_type:complete